MTEKDKELFELQRKVEELEERIAIMTEGLVYCNECKHWDSTTEECSNEKTACYRNGYCPGDWYCADGERK